MWNMTAETWHATATTVTCGGGEQWHDGDYSDTMAIPACFCSHFSLDLVLYLLVFSLALTNHIPNGEWSVAILNPDPDRSKPGSWFKGGWIESGNLNKTKQTEQVALSPENQLTTSRFITVLQMFCLEWSAHSLPNVVMPSLGLLGIGDESIGTRILFRKDHHILKPA